MIYKDIDDIEYLIKRGNNWCNDEITHIYDIDVFMSSNFQFVQISAYVIINLNYVKEYMYESTAGFVIVSNIKFTIARRYLPQTRTKHKAFLKQKYENMKIVVSEKAIYLSKNLNERTLISDNSDDIIFIERKGSVSIVHFKNGHKRSFYESLKYLETFFSENKSLLRIRRNYIVNIRHICDFKALSQNKTGLIKIDEKELSISRRCLPTFKRRRKSV